MRPFRRGEGLGLITVLGPQKPAGPILAATNEIGTAMAL
jgi:hypothetical protein